MGKTTKKEICQVNAKETKPQVTLDQLAKRRKGLPRLPKRVWESWESLKQIKGHLTIIFEDGDESLHIEGSLKLPKKAILGLILMGCILSKYLAKFF